jgi:hypothetical protein
MKCSNSAFNAQGLRLETNYSSCTSKSSEHICSSSGVLRKKERQDETQFTSSSGVLRKKERQDET